MMSANELLVRASEYRETLAARGTSRCSLSHEEEFHHLQMKFRIVDRLVADHGSSFDDHQVFSVAASALMQAMIEALKQDVLLEAVSTDLAASVELACRKPISDVQLSQLCRLLREAGDLYFRSKCFVHAAACYSQSQRGFRKMDALDEARIVEYKLRLSAWRSKRSALRMLGGFWSNALAGFGLRPYRMLWGILAVMVACAVIYQQLIPAQDFEAALFMSVSSYLGILGRSDVVGESLAVRTVVVIESFLSLVLNSTFIALLAKRWFRF